MVLQNRKISWYVTPVHSYTLHNLIFIPIYSKFNKFIFIIISWRSQLLKWKSSCRSQVRFYLHLDARLYRVKHDEDTINLSLSQKDKGRCTVAPFPLNIWAISTSAVGLHLYHIPKVIRMRLRPSKNTLGIVCDSLSLFLYFLLLAICRALKNDRWYLSVQTDKRAMGKTDFTLDIKYEWASKCILLQEELEKISSPSSHMFYFRTHVVELAWVKQ